jgi:putative transposase
MGSEGDREADDALTESVNNLYKRQLVKARGPWKTIDGLELATLAWATWFNRKRLHGTLNDVPPVEHEAAFYAPPTNPTNRWESNGQTVHQDQCD